MFKRAVLHVGTPKTGTSSIQRTAAQSRDVLAAAGILYPGRHDKPVNHYMIGLAMEDHPKPMWALQRLGLSDRQVRKEVDAALERVEGEIAESGETCDTLVLSSESFLYGSSEAFDRLVSFLQRHAERVCVMAYVRHPVSWALSHFQQEIKSGNLRFSDIDPSGVPRLTQRLDLVAASVARCDLVLRPFERAKLAEGDVIDDFFGRLGLTRGQISQLIRFSENESASHEALLLADALSREIPRQVDGKKNPERALDTKEHFQGLRGARLIVSEETMTSLADTAAPEVALLQERYGLTLAPPVVPAEQLLWQEETIEDIALLINKLQRDKEWFRRKLRKLQAKQQGS